MLIVDDDRGFCQLVTRHIESAGIPVETLAAYTGEEGLEFMCEQTPDLLLLDLLLPGKNGLEVLMEMAGGATLCKVPVILLTATSHVEDDLSKDGVSWSPAPPPPARRNPARRCGAITAGTAAWDAPQFK